jgi:phage protein D
MGLIPAYSVTVGGSAPSSAFGQRLLRIVLKETTGKDADKLELQFDDRDNALTLPAKGAVITLAIGYAGAPLVDKGSFTYDTCDIEGPPDKLTLHAKSGDMRGSLKAHKSRAWSNMSTGQIVDQIASENGLTAQTDPTLAGVQVAHKDQTNESDLHFLTRHGKDHDAIATVKGGKLIFAPRGKGTSASGQTLPTLNLARTDLSSWKRTDADRSKFGSVKAKHRDLSAAALNYVTSGTDDPVKTLRHVYPNAGQAQDAADSEHRRLKRKATGVHLELQGDPNAAAGCPVVISGVRDGVDGSWIAAEVEHTLDFGADGYAMSIDVTVDGTDADTSDDTTGYGGDDADTGTDTTAEGDDAPASTPSP